MKLQELNFDELKCVNGGRAMWVPPPGDQQWVSDEGDATTTPAAEDETNMFTATWNMLHDFRF